MRIGFALFIGIVLSGAVVVAFILEYFSNRKITKAHKDMSLQRRNCEVCTAIYFVSVFSEFWRCPRCDSINKEK